MPPQLGQLGALAPVTARSGGGARSGQPFCGAGPMRVGNGATLSVSGSDDEVKTRPSAPRTTGPPSLDGTELVAKLTAPFRDEQRYGVAKQRHSNLERFIAGVMFDALDVVDRSRYRHEHALNRYPTQAINVT